MWSFRGEGCKQLHMLQLWPPMRRKCHLIIIQIDLIWVISCWEQGSFGISLTYQHLHVLIEILLVFSAPFPPCHCKWELVGLEGWKLSRLHFGPAAPSSVCGLLIPHTGMQEGISSLHWPGSRAPVRTQECRRLSWPARGETPVTL